MKRNEEERQQAIEYLKKVLKPGDTVYTYLRHVSRSGMSRHIGVVVINDGRIDNISGAVSTALEMKWNDDGTLSISGCGMDMGFAIVYDLSSTLFPNGCPEEKRGGYCLNQRWL